MIVVGLTGGPGAGKDEAMKIFKGFGAKIINADETGHNLLKKNTSVYKEIIKIFGSGILNSQNEIDRKRLGGIVFGNRKKLTLLNRAIHPLMEKEFRKEIASHRKRGTKFVVLNAAILFVWFLVITDGAEDKGMPDSNKSIGLKYYSYTPLI